MSEDVVVMEWRGNDTYLSNGVLKFGEKYDVVVSGSLGAVKFTAISGGEVIGSVHYRDMESATRKWHPCDS